MRRIIVVIAFMLLSSVVFAQFDPNSSLGQQQNEIANTIKAEVEAQARKQQTQAQQSQTLMNRNQTQTTRQQVIESYNNRISNEGQQRMEYYNNPDNYINREITNRKPSLNSASTQSDPLNRSNSNNHGDLRTEPVHSEALTSKSLQMLREANREQFSSGDRKTAIDPNVKVPLFDAPSLGVPLFDAPNLDEKTIAPSVDQSQTPVEEMAMEAVYEELTPEQKSMYDKMKKEIIERKELAEYRAEIAGINAGLDKADRVFTLESFNASNFREELKAIEKELLQLDELAREAVRNNRNK